MDGRGYDTSNKGHGTKKAKKEIEREKGKKCGSVNLSMKDLCRGDKDPTWIQIEVPQKILEDLRQDERDRNSVRACACTWASTCKGCVCVRCNQEQVREWKRMLERVREREREREGVPSGESQNSDTYPSTGKKKKGWWKRRWLQKREEKVF